MLTDSQVQTYNMIKSFVIENNRMPSYRELAQKLGCTRQNAYQRVSSLKNNHEKLLQKMLDTIIQ